MTEFKSVELQTLKEKLSGAEESFEQLELILQKIDNRSNEVGVFIFNSFALIDIAIVRLFLRWQHTYEQRTNEWIDSLNLFDALVSMGNFRLNEDRAVQAEISEEDKVVYDAKNLYHPSLARRLLQTTSQSMIMSIILLRVRIWQVRVLSCARWV